MSTPINTQANTTMIDPQMFAPSATNSAPTRPMYWSVRRELWENRSIYLAPLIAAAVMLFGFWTRAFHLPARVRTAEALDSVSQTNVLATPYAFTAALIMFTGFMVAVFYCLDALHGERRDRSILFWKSLPVSDLTTVLSKFSIPMVVIPVVTFVTIFTMQLIMRVLSTIILATNGMSAAPVWTQVPFFQMTFVLLYGIATTAIWYAPIYSWLLLVSAWARRNTFLWAIFPPLAICVVEFIVLHTGHFAKMLGERFNSFREGFDLVPDGSVVIPLSQLTPGRFLTSPGLWIGLAFAAAFLAAAVQLRRYRQPI
jgi:ABC-2 type transport system permease protein